MLVKYILRTPMNTLWLASSDLTRSVLPSGLAIEAPENCEVRRQFKQGSSDHPGYPFGRAHWAFVTGVGPFGKKAQAPGSRIPPIRAAAVAGNLYKPCARLREKFAISILAEGTPYGAGSIWRRFRPLVWGEKPQDSRLDSGLRRNDGLKV